MLDGSGALRSGADDASKGLDAQQLQYVQQIEAGYLKRVLEILEPVVGRDNLAAAGPNAVVVANHVSVLDAVIAFDFVGYVFSQIFGVLSGIAGNGFG